MSLQSINAADVAEACVLVTAAFMILISIRRRQHDKKVLYRLVVNGEEQVEDIGGWIDSVEPLQGSRLRWAILQELLFLGLFAISIAKVVLFYASRHGSLLSTYLDCLTAGVLLATWSSRFGLTSHRRTLSGCALCIAGVFALSHLPLELLYSGLNKNVFQSPLDYLRVAQSIVAVVALLPFALTPRVWRPLDPYDPASKASPDQEASYFSLLGSFSWLMPVLTRAWSVSLELEDLPELRDCDKAEIWSEKLPAATNPRVLRAWNLLKVLGPEIAKAAFYDAINSTVYVLKPLLLMQLVRYFEYGRNAQSVLFAPWVYVVLLGLFNTLEMASKSAFFFFSIRMGIHLQISVIQALFTKTLAVRFWGDDGIDLHNPTTSSQVSNAKTTSKMGQVNNLMSSDIKTFHEARDGLQIFFSISWVILGSLIALQFLIGWIAYVGALIVLVFCLTLQMFVRLGSKYQDRLRSACDVRIGAITEILRSVRMIKYFGWEELVTENLINPKREVELRMAFQRGLFEVAVKVLFSILPLTCLLVVFGLVISVREESIAPSIAYTIIALFAAIQIQFNRLIGEATAVSDFLVSWRRINDFLNDDDTVDIQSKNELQNDMAFINATLSWTAAVNKSVGSFADEEDTFKDSRTVKQRLTGHDLSEPFCLKNLNINFQQGTLTVVTGPIASGKSSLLLGLLQEMKLHEGRAILPRHLGVSYVPQVAWLLNATIKDNITFQSTTPFDSQRYHEVIYACGLESDLANLAAGDLTEIGERGLTLSGGQKQRVSLARAVYATTQIVLLDDVFSALDATTAKHVFERCICGPILGGRTIVLVTHQLSLVATSADRIIQLSHGRIEDRFELDTSSDKNKPDLNSSSLIDNAVTTQKKNFDLIDDNMKSLDVRSDITKMDESRDGKLVMTEERAHGRVNKRHLLTYLGYMGVPTVILVLILSATGIALRIFGPLTLGLLNYEAKDAETDSLPSRSWLSTYLGIWILTLIANFLYYATFMYAKIVVARRIHSDLLHAVLNAPLPFFDTTPTGRILNRFSNDITTIDHHLPINLRTTLESMMEVLLGALVLTSFLPATLIASILVVVLAVAGAEFYIRAQVSTKRIVSVMMSPLINGFNDGLAGNVIIRAFSRQSSFLVANLDHLNNYTKSFRALYNLNRWISNYIGLCEAIIPFTTGFLALLTDLSPKVIGLNLTAAQQTQRSIIECVRYFNDVEIDLNSMERIEYYIQGIAQEPKATAAGEPPASWPTNGKLEVRNLTVRYRANTPDVLNQMNFDILPGERVGVVGTTGVGKSTLAITLLRFTHITAGSVKLDGRDIMKTNLHTLRRRVAFIPQDPSCLQGTVRFNLDPFDEVDETELNTALEASGLVDQTDDETCSSATSLSSENFQKEVRRKRISLDTQITHGGGNLSQGQRQLLAFARALVRRSKLIILDEATSFIDSTTDAKIQETIRKSFKDCSILTIAHRLRTVMEFDRIMVLGNPDGAGGRVVEFDTPLSLLQRKGGVLAKFAKDTGELEELRRMASAGRVS